MRFLFAAGGTAGHINPALAIADKLKALFPACEIRFVGTPKGMEAELVEKAGYPFTGIPMSGLQRKLTPKNIARNITAVYHYLHAKTLVKKLLHDFAPDAVIGTGGYVSAPVLRTAAALGIKTATHESNSYPGMATKMLSKYVDRVFVAEQDALQHIPYRDKCRITGNPMRVNIPIISRQQALQSLGLPEGITILSFGGSLGANKITEAVVSLISWENKNRKKQSINHIHAYGKNGRGLFESLCEKNGVVPDPKHTIIKEYLYQINTCYCAADIIISRSGSMTQTELKMLGKASIQIPWSGAAENHQYHNAMTMKNAGAAEVIADNALTPEKLVHTVERLLAEEGTLAKMGEQAKSLAISNAAEMIVSEILDLIRVNN